MTAELQIRLFGGLEVCIGDQPVAALVSNKAPALLAYLAVVRRPQSRDTMAALLWGEMGEADAKNNLRQVLTSLRKPLDPYLDITRDAIALRSDAPCRLDVAHFDAALHRTRQASGPARLGHLQLAAELYRGDFLEGFLVRDAPEFEDWALALRTRYRELALQTLHALTACYLDGGEYLAAIDTATRLLAMDAWREESHRQLMLAQARTGQFSAALAQYQHCRRLLAEAFDAEPAEATTVLYARIRDALQAPRHNLPAQLTGFVGREAEIDTVHRRLADPACRLLAIVGQGGAGKSRLAMEAAQALLPAFLNGVWFVSLAAVVPGEPGALPAALAAALEIPVDAGNLRRQVTDYLRRRELLLILDNLEHLLDDTAWLSELLAAAPELKLLATSRVRLNLQAEQVLPLGGLPTTAQTEEAPEANPAAALFVRRARRVQPDFALTPAVAGAVVQICQMVDGLPLGIELAAPWVSQFTCHEIAAAIAANLDFLQTNRRDVTPRQRSLRATFEYSWRLLATAEQQAFARLAVFPGTFTRAAAAAVADVRAPVLAELVDRSLVRKEAGDRYTLHDVLRRFAHERWQTSPAEVEALERRHSAWYLQWLAEQTGSFKGRAQKEVMVAAGCELENIRSAWQAAVAGRWLDALAPAVEAIYHFFMLRSWLAEGLDLFRRARQSLEKEPAPTAAVRQVAGRLALREAKFLLTLSRYGEAEALLLHAERRLADEATPADMATLGHYLGQVYASTGRYADAEEQVQASLALRRMLDDTWGQAVLLLEISGIAYYRGRYQMSQAACEDGLRLAEAVGDLQTIAHFLTALSILTRELGDLAAAQHYAERGLAVYEELESPYGRIQGLLTLGGLALAQGEATRALPYFEEALSASQTLGFQSGEADGLYRLGQAAALLGEETKAAVHLRLALLVATAAQEAPLVLDILCASALLLAAASLPAAPLLRWLIDQPELDDRRRRAVTAHISEMAATPGAADVVSSVEGAVAYATRLFDQYLPA